MATLSEIEAVWADDTLRAKVEAALTLVAETVRTEDEATANHANRIKLAKKVFDTPQQFAEDFLRAMVAQNADLAVASITGASDSAIENNVAAAWDVFADGS